VIAVSKTRVSEEEDLDGWLVSVSTGSSSGTRFIQETMPRAAALRALSGMFRSPGRTSAEPGCVVFCLRKSKEERKTTETWTFETNEQGELNEGTCRHHLPKADGGLDEVRIEQGMALLKPLAARVGRAELAHWVFLDRVSGRAKEPEHAEVHRRLLEAMGGPPGPDAMRAWLDGHLAARDSGANTIPRSRSAPFDTTLRPGPHVREQPCPHCAAVTTQTRHGYTLSGRLWKGHACTCHGWECRGCGAVLEPEGECCR
jgi:hypothetical protein